MPRKGQVGKIVEWRDVWNCVSCGKSFDEESGAVACEKEHHEIYRFNRINEIPNEITEKKQDIAELEQELAKYLEEEKQ